MEKEGTRGRGMAKHVIVDNPATGEVFAEVALEGAEEVEARARRAVEAQREWAKTPVSSRSALVERFVERMIAAQDQIAHDVSGMMGKPRLQAMKEVATMAERAR